MAPVNNQGVYIAQIMAYCMGGLYNITIATTTGAADGTVMVLNGANNTLEWGGPLKGLRLRAGSAITFGDSTTMTSAMGSITIPGSNGQVILSDGAGGVSAANQISIAANAVQIQGHAVVAPTTAGYGQFLQYVSGGWAVATPEPGTNALAIQGIHEQRHGSGV